MTFIGDKTRRFAANSLFPSLFYAALGLVLVQVGVARLHGSWGLHIFLGAPALALSGLVLCRMRLHWGAGSTGMLPYRPRAMGWYLLLLAAGVVMGEMVSAGSLLLLGVVAAFTYLLPWTKIPVCRGRAVASSLAMLAGAVFWVVIPGRQVQPVYFIRAAWMLYLPIMFLHILILVSLDRAYRIPDRAF